tara:strand:- start:155 stop:559 length:405 start_codon:yes stop_codon:yes gene_type:complete
MTIDFTIWLGIALLASITANIFAFWYIRRLLSKLWFVAENISDLVALITNYRIHLKTIFELEDYYGDEHIKFVLSHTTSLISVLEEYEDIYSIVEESEEEIEEDENQQEEIEEYAEKTQSEKNVFYAGTRGRNS